MIRRTWIDLKGIMLSENQSQKVTQCDSKYNIFKTNKNKLQKWRIDQWFPQDKDGVGGVGVTTMKLYKIVPSGDGTCLDPDCGGGSTHLHMRLSCTELCA